MFFYEGPIKALEKAEELEEKLQNDELSLEQENIIREQELPFLKDVLQSLVSCLNEGLYNPDFSFEENGKKGHIHFNFKNTTKYDFNMVRFRVTCGNDLIEFELENWKKNANRKLKSLVNKEDIYDIQANQIEIDLYSIQIELYDTAEIFSNDFFYTTKLVDNRLTNFVFSNKKYWDDLEDKLVKKVNDGKIEDVIKELVLKRTKFIRENNDDEIEFDEYYESFGKTLHSVINNTIFDLCFTDDKNLKKDIAKIIMQKHSDISERKPYSLYDIDVIWLSGKGFPKYGYELPNYLLLSVTDLFGYCGFLFGVDSNEKFNDCVDTIKNMKKILSSNDIQNRIENFFISLPNMHFFEVDGSFYKTKKSSSQTYIDFDVDYNRNPRVSYDKKSKKLIFEINLPVWDEKLTASEKKGYNRYIYSLVLSMVKNIFGLDYDNEIATLVFNGRIETYNNVTGEEINPIILSLVIDREEFEKITNFEKVDPEAWYKKNKGTSAAYLSDMVAIKPHSQIFEKDSRIIEHYKVADGLSDDENIATMYWKDFENLVREIFEKEFGDKGFDVKITQSSKDGGVDAIMYDPNPLTGGKIIIQAKRYTNVVGVAAVRDLYGTVINEGANKGILVTTAYYGKDAYNFVKDKPITLIDGPNLLYLLKKHNYSMTIDLEKAKKELKEQGQ